MKYNVTQANWGPAGVIEGYIAFKFTCLLDGKEVSGTYDPKQTSSPEDQINYHRQRRWYDSSLEGLVVSE